MNFPDYLYALYDRDILVILAAASLGTWFLLVVLAVMMGPEQGDKR